MDVRRVSFLRRVRMQEMASPVAVPVGSIRFLVANELLGERRRSKVAVTTGIVFSAALRTRRRRSRKVWTLDTVDVRHTTWERFRVINLRLKPLLSSTNG